MYYGEAVWTTWVSCSVATLMDGGWSPEVHLYPVPQCSARLCNVLVWAIYIWELEFVYYATFMQFVVLVLGSHEECFNSVYAFEMNLNFFVFASPF